MLANLPRGIAGNTGRPACAYALGSIDETHRDNGNVPFRFHHFAIVLQIFKNVVVRFWENVSSQGGQAGVNVSCRGMVFASFESGTEHSVWSEQVDVVGTDEVLSHSNDGLGQGHFSMVVGRVLCDVTRKLCHLQFFLQISLETSVQDLPLSRLQSVDNVRNRPLIVSD